MLVSPSAPSSPSIREQIEIAVPWQIDLDQCCVYCCIVCWIWQECAHTDLNKHRKMGLSHELGILISRGSEVSV